MPNSAPAPSSSMMVNRMLTSCGARRTSAQMLGFGSEGERRFADYALRIDFGQARCFNADRSPAKAIGGAGIMDCRSRKIICNNQARARRLLMLQLHQHGWIGQTYGLRRSLRVAKFSNLPQARLQPGQGRKRFARSTGGCGSSSAYNATGNKRRMQKLPRHRPNPQGSPADPFPRQLI